MSIITIILSLLLEQAKPVAVGRVNGWLESWSSLLARHFDSGQRAHGVAAWFVGVALPALVLLGIDIVVSRYSVVLQVVIGIAVLYVTTGFRQFSHHYTTIHQALRDGDIELARRRLAAWRGYSGDRPSSGEVARLSIEDALLASHHHVFAPFFWFALLGPAGALFYRLARHFRDSRPLESTREGGVMPDVARQAFRVIDWLPVRLSAASFAIVGNFEDAVDCWRNQASQWQDESDGILLAAGAGALGVRLGMPVATGDVDGGRPELGVGDEADADYMQSAVGLVWRALVMALLLLTLLAVANWAG